MKMILAAVLATAALGAPASAATLLTNGSFEEKPGSLFTASGNGWAVYPTIPGWTTSGQGVELQTDAAVGSIDAQNGEVYVELDSHPNPGSNSAIQQLVNITSVGDYLLRFFYSPRTGDPKTNKIEYSFNGVKTVLTGPGSDPKTSVGEWTLIEKMYNVTAVGHYSLEFAAKGTEDTLGGFIDNVSLAAVPLPAAGMLLLTAFGGLGLARRLKRA